MVDKYLGEMPDKASKGFPQVSSDPDVMNMARILKTMNIVLVLTSSMDMIGCVSNSIRISSVLSCIKIKR